MIKIFYLLLLYFISSTSLATEKILPSSNDEMILSFSPLVKQASPAVVNIFTKKKVEIRLSPFFSDPFFGQFFNKNILNDLRRKRIETSLGSGVVIGSDGLIVTNNHVVAGSDEIVIAFADKSEYEAKIIINDKKTDLAFLKIINHDGARFKHLQFMDSDKLEVGDIVLAIGNPFGIGQTVTSGIVSALARTTVGISDYEFFIQTDAAINPGNSGGALINMEGKLAGINTAIFSKSGGSHGIGFAIPGNMVSSLIRNINSQGKVVRPWLGISGQGVSKDIAEAIGLKKKRGIIINKILPKSTAEASGLKVGDVILAIDETALDSPETLDYKVATYPINRTANFTILRGRKKNTIKVKMSAPPEIPKRQVKKIKGRNILSGATIANLSPALAIELGLDPLERGVIIYDLSPGNAASLGIRKKDIVIAINDAKISVTQDALQAISKSASKYKITLKRANRLFNIIWRGR